MIFKVFIKINELSKIDLNLANWSDVDGNMFYGSPVE